jgi:hypothetical protein
MKITKFIITLLTPAVLVSCGKKHRLSQKDYLWMPYKGNEVLIFASNTGDTDSIFFLKKDTLIDYPEAQAINGNTYEVVRIFARHSDASRDFIELKKSRDKKTRLHFNLSAKDAVFYRLTGVGIDSLSQQAPASLTTESKTYNDVYIIDDEDWLNFKQRSNYVTKLYWSKSEGLIRYDKQDGIYWEPTKKYSP